MAITNNIPQFGNADTSSVSSFAAGGIINATDFNAYFKLFTAISSGIIEVIKDKATFTIGPNVQDWTSMSNGVKTALNAKLNTLVSLTYGSIPTGANVVSDLTVLNGAFTGTKIKVPTYAEYTNATNRISTLEGYFTNGVANNATNATNATSATNLAGGEEGKVKIAYQNGIGVTAYIDDPDDGYNNMLGYDINESKFTWHKIAESTTDIASNSSAIIKGGVLYEALGGNSSVTKPVLANDNNKIKVTICNKASDPITVAYATAAGTAGSATTATKTNNSIYLHQITVSWTSGTDYYHFNVVGFNNSATAINTINGVYNISYNSASFKGHQELIDGLEYYWNGTIIDFYADGSIYKIRVAAGGGSITSVNVSGSPIISDTVTKIAVNGN